MKTKLLPITLIASAMLLGSCSLIRNVAEGILGGQTSTSEEQSSSSSSSSSSGHGSSSSSTSTSTSGGGHGSSSSSGSTVEEPELEQEVFNEAGKGNGWSSASGTAITSPRAQADYTILVYLCGSNLESYDSQYGEWGSMASRNLLEMMEVGIPSNVNVVIETGGAKRNSNKSSWNNTLLSQHQSGLSIKDKALERWHIENHRLVKDEEVSTYSGMGLQTTFSSFIEYGTTRFPAKKTGVVMWDHGGAMMGCCQDENTNDMLTPFEMDAALDSALCSSKLEWIGYDCCLMNVADIASLNSEHFNYMVASQETEPGEGWDYNGWLDNVVANVNISTSSLLNEICDTYVQKCGDNYNAYGNYYIAYGNYMTANNITDEDGYTGADYVQAGQQYLNYNDATLSVLDLSKMAAFDSAWNALGSSMQSKISSQTNWDTFSSNVLENSLRFGGDEGYWGDMSYDYDVFDAEDVINGIKSKYSLSVTSVTSAMSQLITHNSYGQSYTGSNTPCGLCVYLACENSASQFGVTSSNAIYSNWFTLYNQYGGNSSGGWGW